MKKNDPDLKKDEILKGLQIEALSSDGSGITRIDGYPVFIKDALPGDIVTAKLIKVKKDMAFARLMDIEKASDDRVDPKCASSRPCGGCSIQELSYEKQLEYKDDKVYNCLLRIGGIPAKILDKAHEEPTGMDKPWRYRNKAQFPIGRSRDGRLISGFYAGRTHHIVETEDCVLNPPEFAAILRTFLNYCEENRIEPYDEQTGRGLVRHLLIRKGFTTGELMIMPVVRKLEAFGERKREALKEAMIGIPDLATIVLNENPEKTNVILGKRTEIIYGPGYIKDRLGDLEFEISPLSFYQVNSVQALKVYEKALEYAHLTGEEKVYDLCCGIGTISLFAAQKAKFVYGIEAVSEAIEDAKRNAALNGVSNVEFTAVAVEEYLPEAGAFSADVIILDPPRSGMQRPALDAIVSASPSRIVYISCDPATQARDLKVFLAAGYHLTRFTAIDQFCHTSHVETVCLLSKLHEAKHHINVKVDMDELDLTSAEAKATYKEIEEWVQEHYGFHVTNLNIAQVKQKHGIIERENYNKPKSEDSRQPGCPEEKIKAIEDAMRHFQMI